MKEEIKAGALEFLFSDELYIPVEQNPVQNQIVQESSSTYSAQLNKRLVILSKSDLNSAEKELLIKVLSAAKVQNDFIARSTASLKTIDFSLESQVKEVICFGVNAFEAGFTTHSKGLYEVQETNSKKVLTADSLSTISTDNNKKKALWLALQRMFNL